MKSWICGGIMAAVVLAFASTASTPVAFAQSAPARQAQAGRETHPVLQRAIRQLEGVKDELQKAPDDFHGHKAAAIDAINHAMTELRAGIASDKK